MTKIRLIYWIIFGTCLLGYKEINQISSFSILADKVIFMYFLTFLYGQFEEKEQFEPQIKKKKDYKISFKNV